MLANPENQRCQNSAKLNEHDIICILNSPQLVVAICWINLKLTLRLPQFIGKENYIVCAIFPWQLALVIVTECGVRRIKIVFYNSACCASNVSWKAPNARTMSEAFFNIASAVGF